jgi:Tfp pilus assembly protein PilF
MVCAVVALWLVYAASGFSQAKEDSQQEYSSHLQRAHGYLSEKKPDLAIQEFKAAAAINPGSAETQGNLGVLLYFQNRFSEAIPPLRAALSVQPTLVKIQGLLGLAESRSLDFVNARKDLAAALPQIPDKTFKSEVGLELVGLYTQSGDLEEAAAALSLLRKTDPTNTEVLYAAYRTYSDLSSESMLALALAAPDSAQMHQLLAHEEVKEGNTNGAIAQFRKAIAINTHLPGVHFELAELLNTSPDAAIKQEAEQEYRAALKEDPLHEKAELRLGEIDAAKGNIPQASEELSRAVELQPEDSDAKLDLAKLLIENNQPDKALLLLQETVRIEPTNPMAHYRLSTLYRKQGKAEEAKREVELYKQYKDIKEKLRATYKDLLIKPNEISSSDQNEK